MGIIGGELGYKILKYIAPRAEEAKANPEDYEIDKYDTKLEQFFGDSFFDTIRGKTIIDFGCGLGYQSIEMAINGAKKVIGLDIQTRLIEHAKQKAIKLGVSNNCEFTTQTTERVDVIISKDAFEHFSDVSYIFEVMASLLKPNGCLLTSFGPTWLHPYGGHLFSIFPWSHLIFTENAQIKWRSDFKTDGATKFSEVEGGLNKLTISEFESIVADSPFRIHDLKTIPIKGISIFKNRMFREFGSSIVQSKLYLK